MSDHDRAFFEQMATCRDAYRRLADAIHLVLRYHPPPRRVLDIGAGLGFVPARLAELGWEATASDPYAPEDLRDTACVWAPLLPLGVPWRLLSTPLDVVVCTEVAEHIEPGNEETIAANVAGAARYFIVWSAAQPGQEWPGHVNLRPADYWLEKFDRLGFRVLTNHTATLRAEMRARHAQHEHAADNFFTLERRP